MARNLDGIKKLNLEEVGKHRKIVLDYIGEKDNKETGRRKNLKQSIFASRRVDGINLSKNIHFAAAVKSRQAEERERLNLAIKRQEEERKRAKEEEKLYQARKEQAEKEHRLKEKEKMEWEKEKLRREELVKREIAWRAEAEAELKRRQEIKLSQKLERQKRKLKRQRAFRKFKKNFSLKSGQLLVAAKKNIVYLITFLILFSAAAYVILCLIVLRFNLNNNLIKNLGDYLSVPAVVSNQGIISYHDFQKIKAVNYNYDALAKTEQKNILADWIVSRNLKYNLDLPDNALENELSLKFTMSEKFNQIGFYRIKKISQLLKNGGDFERLSKYADEYSGGVYYGKKDLAEKFGQAAVELALGQTSDILPRTDGYYFIKKLDDKNGKIGLAYLFVGAQSLDEYVKKKLQNIKIFILAD